MKARAGNTVSTHVVIVRSPSGDWRVARYESELAAEDVSVGIQVFRGWREDSPSLLMRVAWAAGEVWRIVNERRGL